MGKEEGILILLQSHDLSRNTQRHAVMLFSNVAWASRYAGALRDARKNGCEGAYRDVSCRTPISFLMRRRGLHAGYFHAATDDSDRVEFSISVKFRINRRSLVSGRFSSNLQFYFDSIICFLFFCFFVLFFYFKRQLQVRWCDFRDLGSKVIS